MLLINSFYWSFNYYFFFFIKTSFFIISFRFTEIEQKVLYTPFLSPAVFSIFKILYWYSTLVTIDKSLLIHYYLLNPYFSLGSCCMLYILWCPHIKIFQDLFFSSFRESFFFYSILFLFHGCSKSSYIIRDINDFISFFFSCLHNLFFLKGFLLCLV